MKIKRIKLDRFGCLKGEYILPADKCALIVEDNEAGKSTLVDAIIAGIYGFQGTPLKEIKQSAGLEDRSIWDIEERYKPWTDNYGYAVEVTILAKDGEVAISRDFKGGKLTARKGGMDITNNYSGRGRDNLGHSLLGMEWWSFKRIFLVRQDDVDSVTATKSLTALVQNAATSQRDNTTGSEAITKLNRALAGYNYDPEKAPVAIATAISRITTEQNKWEETKRSLVNGLSQIDSDYRRLQEIETTQNLNENKIKELKYLSLLAEAKELDEFLTEQDGYKKDLGEKEGLLAERKQYETFPATQYDDVIKWCGQWQALKKIISTKTQQLTDDVVSPLGEIEEKLNQDARFAEITDAGIEALQAQVTLLTTESKKLDDNQNALKQLERASSTEGHAIGELEELNAKFSNLSDGDKTLCRTFQNSMLGHKNKQAAIEGDKTRLEQTIEQIDNLRQQQKKTAIGLIGAGVVSGVVAVILFMSAGTGAGIAGMVLALGFASAGVARMISSGSLDADKRATAYSSLKGKEQELLRINDELKKTNYDAQAIADKAGIRSIEELDKQYGRYLELQQRFAPLHDLVREINAIEGNVKGYKDEIRKWLAMIGEDVAIEQITPALAEGVLSDGKSYQELRKKRDSYNESKTAKEGEINKDKEALEEVEGNIRKVFKITVLQDAEDIDVEEGLRKFKEGKEKFDEYCEINKAITGLKGQVKGQQELYDKSTRFSRVAGDRELLSSEHVEFKNLPADKSRTDYNSEIELISKGASSDERDELKDRIGPFLQKYNDEYPKALEQIEKLTQNLEKAERFKGAVESAVSAIEGVSKDVYGQWAKNLNERVNAILPKFNKTYGSIRFNDDLTFSVVAKKGEVEKEFDREKVTLHLNRGAQDQLYLAIRIGISEYLSESVGNLPIILDEPFANTDDERFKSGMAFLVKELSKRHQVIILTCHKQRHEWLKTQMPELFEDNIVEIPLKKSAQACFMAD